MRVYLVQEMLAVIEVWSSCKINVLEILIWWCGTVLP